MTVAELKLRLEIIRRLVMQEDKRRQAAILAQAGRAAV